MKYLHVTTSKPDILQQYLDDVAIAGAEIYRQGGFEVVEENGKPAIICLKNGKPNPQGQKITAFDIVTKKVGEKGYYCLNAREYYADAKWVDALPDYIGYKGIKAVDDVSKWQKKGDD